MKNLILLLLLTITAIGTNAQIGGLSASKISSMTVDCVDHHKLEFEPGFAHARASKYWDNDGNLKNIYSTGDSTRLITGMWFRFTYGLWDKLEIGATVSNDLAVMQLGMRYVITQKEKAGLAAIAGVNIPFGNRTVDQRIRATGNLMQVGFGLVGTYNFNENFSVDMTGQYVFFTKESADHDRGGVYLNADAGYYFFNHTFQLIGGLGYHSITNDIGNHQTLTVYPGVTIETGKSYILVLTFPFDIYGKREAQNYGFSLALTLTFD
jgi:hypothetical protein